MKRTLDGTPYKTASPWTVIPGAVIGRPCLYLEPNFSSPCGSDQWAGTVNFIYIFFKDLQYLLQFTEAAI